MILKPYLLCDGPPDRHKSHLLQVMSPNLLSSNTPTPKRSNLKTSSQKSWALRNLGKIGMKYRKDWWELTTRIQSLRIWMNLVKLVQRRPTSSHRCIPITTQRRALQTRILKMASPLFAESRRPWGPSNANRNSETCCALLQEKGGSAERAQADLRKGFDV